MKQILLSLATVVSFQLSAQQLYFLDFIAIPYETENEYVLDSMQLNVLEEVTKIKCATENGLLQYLVAFEPDGPTEGDTTYFSYSESHHLQGSYTFGADTLITQLNYSNDTVVHEMVYDNQTHVDSLVYHYDELGRLQSKTSYGVYDTSYIEYMYEGNRIIGLNYGLYISVELFYDENGNLYKQEVYDMEDNLLGFMEYFYSTEVITNTSKIEENAVRVFPNPIQKGNTLQIQGVNNKNWVIYDLTGKHVASSSINQNNMISTSGLPSGLYILQIDGMPIKKVMIK